jgi:PAS domain S-box-containing protein
MAFVQGPHPIAPFLLFYPAIAGAAFIGGAGPGFLVIAGSAAFGTFLFPVFPSVASWIALGTFGPAFALGFARIREQRHRTEAVAAESARLRFVIEKVSDWIFLVDDEGKIEYANQTACDWLGYSREELTGRFIADFEANPRNPLLPRFVAECGKGPVAPTEVFFVRRDGAKIAAEVSCTSIQVGTDHVIHVAARDVTERRQLDQKLREARQWESLGSLTGGLAHDFNNLLTAIMGNASLARELIASDAEAVGLLLSVEQAGERCAELIRMMLAASGYRPRHAQRLQVDRLAWDAVAARPLPAGVKVLIDAPPCEFESDRASVETLLAGLISNAAESYGAGPGEVRVSVLKSNAPRLAPGSFQEGEAREGPYIGIVVEDRGSGMTPETVERAFNPFFSTKFTGRGLGLPAVRGIVRAHSGILWMRTAPGEGTRVEVWLPAAGYHLSEPTSAHV